MKYLTVKSGLLAALTQMDGREFTVADLTNIYLNDPKTLHHSKKSARQFVYRNMVRLIASGDLMRVVVDGSWPLYRLTSQFFGRNSSSSSTSPAPPQGAATSEIDPRQNLQERLNRYKLEMLATMGETDEYGAICAEIPELRDEVQPLYNQSRDECSKLLGRVKALESLLSKETGSPQ